MLLRPRMMPGAALRQLVERPGAGRGELDALVMVQLLDISAGLGRHGGDNVGLGNALWLCFCFYWRKHGRWRPMGVGVGVGSERAIGGCGEQFLGAAGVPAQGPGYVARSGGGRQLLLLLLLLREILLGIGILPPLLLARLVVPRMTGQAGEEEGALQHFLLRSRWPAVHVGSPLPAFFVRLMRPAPTAGADPARMMVVLLLVLLPMEASCAGAGPATRSSPRGAMIAISCRCGDAGGLVPARMLPVPPMAIEGIVGGGFYGFGGGFYGGGGGFYGGGFRGGVATLQTLRRGAQTLREVLVAMCQLGRHV